MSWKLGLASVAPPSVQDSHGGDYRVSMSRSPFNDTYHYVDLLLTVTWLLIELILVRRLPSKEAVALSWELGLASVAPGGD